MTVPKEISDALAEAANHVDERIAWVNLLHDDMDVLRHGPMEPLSYEDTAQSFCRLFWNSVLHDQSIEFPAQHSAAPYN